MRSGESLCSPCAKPFAALPGGLVQLTCVDNTSRLLWRNGLRVLLAAATRLHEHQWCSLESTPAVYKLAAVLLAHAGHSVTRIIHKPPLGPVRPCKALLRSCAPATPLNLGKADPLI